MVGGLGHVPPEVEHSSVLGEPPPHWNFDEEDDPFGHVALRFDHDGITLVMLTHIEEVPPPPLFPEAATTAQLGGAHP